MSPLLADILGTYWGWAVRLLPHTRREPFARRLMRDRCDVGQHLYGRQRLTPVPEWAGRLMDIQTCVICGSRKMPAPRTDDV